MRANGDANLAVLQGFVSDLRSSGAANLSATLEGPLDDPVVGGTLAIKNGRVRWFALPHALEKIDGAARFDSRGVDPRRADRRAGRRRRDVRRTHRQGRVSAGPARRHDERARHAAALPRGHALARRCRPDAAGNGGERHAVRAGDGEGRRLHERRSRRPAVSSISARTSRWLPPRPPTTETLPVRAGRSRQRALHAADRQPDAASGGQRRPAAARDDRQAGAARAGRDRARRGAVRGQALPAHARDGGLQQSHADRAVPRHRGRDAHPRASGNLSGHAADHWSAGGAELHVQFGSAAGRSRDPGPGVQRRVAGSETPSSGSSTRTRRSSVCSRSVRRAR